MSNRFQRNPKQTLALFVAGAVFGLFLVLELALRFMGYKAGQINNDIRYSIVDTVKTLPFYSVDSFGILSVSSQLANDLSQKLPQTDSANLSKVQVYDQLINQTVFDCWRLNYLSEAKSKTRFGYFLDSIQKKTIYNAVDSLYLAYAQAPFNSDGFRSIPFRPVSTHRKKVLLIGDSFTFGLCAEPIYNSFADQLSSQGFVVYNAGMPTADPAQYESVARKWIPILKPDFVVTVFYMGNDLMFAKRKPCAGCFAHFPTNAGWLNAAPRGLHLPDAETTYRYVQDWHFIPKNRNVFNWLCAQTVVGTKFWSLLSQLKLIKGYSAEFDEYYQSTEPLLSKESVSESYLWVIDSVAKAHDAKPIVALLPDGNDLELKSFQKKLNFKRLPFSYPDSFSVENYQLDCGGHLNNRGEEAFAHWLQKLLEEKPKP